MSNTKQRRSFAACGCMISHDAGGVERLELCRLHEAGPDMLAICLEIAGDKRVDLVDSERRIRLYAAITKAGGVL